VLSLCQFDPKVAGRREHALVPAGLIVVRTKKHTYPSRIWSLEEGCVGGVVGEQPAILARDVSLTIRLLPDCLYYAVPYSLPGVQAAFMLRLYSSGVVELQRARAPIASSVRGQWIQGYAGGRRGNASFLSNPQFLLAIPRASRREEASASSPSRSRDATSPSRVGGGAEDEGMGGSKSTGTANTICAYSLTGTAICVALKLVYRCVLSQSDGRGTRRSAAGRRSRSSRGRRWRRSRRRKQ
jgi:hypothetical protein